MRGSRSQREAFFPSSLWKRAQCAVARCTDERPTSSSGLRGKLKTEKIEAHINAHCASVPSSPPASVGFGHFHLSPLHVVSASKHGATTRQSEIDFACS